MTTHRERLLGQARAGAQRAAGDLSETAEPNCRTCRSRVYFNILSQAWIHGDRTLDTHLPVPDLDDT